MTREKAIEILQLRAWRIHSLPSDLAEAILYAEKNLQEPERKWIPVSERSPDKNGNYLITVRSYDETGSIEFMCVDHCNSDGTWLHYKNSSNKKRDEVVIAWQPLPEPYNEGDQECTR